MISVCVSWYNSNCLRWVLGLKIVDIMWGLIVKKVVCVKIMEIGSND